MTNNELIKHKLAELAQLKTDLYGKDFLLTWEKSRDELEATFLAADILREMRQKPGEPFNSKLARRSMQRVYNLGFFEDVNIKMNPGVDPNAVVMELDVTEKRTGSFGIGAGYSSEDGVLGMVSIGDTNFRGTGDAISLTYEKSGDDTEALAA
jgi:outer membrane translocation and assembly module TamA